MHRFATTVDEAIAACSAEEPLAAGDDRYLDLTEARGEPTRAVIKRSLMVREPGASPAKMMLLSHRGSGKSTELLRLKGELEGANRYRCLYLEANVEMDPNGIESEDLLLALARAVDGYMRDEQHLPLPDDKLERVTAWFSEVLKTTEWGRSVVRESSTSLSLSTGPKQWFGDLLAKVSAITRHESKHRVEVREAFQRYPGALRDAVNELFDLANQLLALNNRGELLVIIDNLDRYPPSVVDKLLLQEADRIEELRCNFLLTPPISLHYRPASISPAERYDCQVMPAVRLRDREDPYSTLRGPGRDLLLQALAKRMHLSLIPEVAVQERLVTASGGAMRDLLKLVANAALRSEGDTISAMAVEAAVRLKRSEMRDQINANGWARGLAGIAARKQIDGDDACQDVLYHRLAFKYNGEGWYDIHPLVDEVEEVRREYKKSSIAPS